MTALLQATCVLIGNTGILLRGPSGSGKSDLALRLLDDGAALVGDDYCAYEVRGCRLFARPQQTTAGLLEVRGMGILRLSHEDEAEISVVFDLVPGQTVERLPEPQWTELFGVRLRLFQLDPFEASAAAKVRLAVRLAAGNIVAAS